MMSILLTLLGLLNPKTTWRALNSVGIWLRPQGLARTKPLAFSIGEYSYQITGSPPYKPEDTVTSVVFQVIINNPDPKKQWNISTFDLRWGDQQTKPLSEAGTASDGDSILVPSSGGFATVPNRNYLQVPVRVGALDSVNGWIGFTFIGDQERSLTCEDASRWQPIIIARLTDLSSSRRSAPRFVQ